MWNKMHSDNQIPSKIDISDNVKGTSNYDQETINYQQGKLSLYTADAFEKYASQIGSGIGESLLTKLNNYSATGAITNTNNSSVVNNKNNSSNSAVYQFNGNLVFPNVDSGVNDVFTSVINQAKQLAILKK
jgi:hypothetical protein